MTATAASPAPAPAAGPRPATFRKRNTGFTPIDHRTVFYDLTRLTGGKTQLACVLYVLSETDGKARAGGTAAPTETRPISTEELAWYCRETLRAVQAAIDDLCERSVLARKQSKRGLYVYSAPTAGWDKLPDYQPPKKGAASAEEIDSAADADDENKEDPESQRRILRWTAEPVVLKAGHPSKAFEVPGKVEKVQIASNAAGQIEGVLKRGILRLSLQMSSVVNGGRSAGEEQAKVQRRILRSNSNGVAIAALSEAVQARGAPLEAAVSARENAVEVASTREVLNRWFQGSLGPADDDLVLKAIAARGQASWTDCLKKLQARSKAGFCKTWGGVLQVISDVGAAAQRANTAAPALSAEELRDAEAFLERQKSMYAPAK